MVAELTGRDRDEVIAAARGAQPFGRFTSAEEVAALVAFLASPLAGTISGTTIPVDGGATGVG
jgi:NAD(P)-dependent dehydrogenase (short-subunit alcohol dehydrogenase family)